jgi:flavin reductase (DIM6/NTAB) family NADH-FMN oxidoreductase RutF
MTIHSDHPFAEPEGERDPVRRLRGRLGGTVSLWTTGQGKGRAGLTVSSYLVANGDPAHLLALIDPDSDLADAVRETGTAVVQLLEWPHRDLAEAFAGLAPAPGGVFTLGSWQETPWGPVLEGTSAWAGVRLAEGPREVGWSLLLDGVVEKLVVGDEREPLVHRRGRYVRPEAPG